MSIVVLILTAIILSQLCSAQTATLGLSDGFISFNTSTFAVQLVKDSQTLHSLRPLNNMGNFDFIPSDQMQLRQFNGNYHLGDVTYRARLVGTTSWISGDTSTSRKPVTPISATGPVLAAANLSPTLPANSLLNITRRWVLNQGVLELLFDVTNPQNSAVEVGALGAPLEFNNVSLGYKSIFASLISICRRYLQAGQLHKPMSCVVSSIPILVRTPAMSRLLRS